MRIELANALKHHGKLFEAAEELRAVVNAEPDNADAWIARGLVYLQMGCPLLADVHFTQRCVPVERGDALSVRARHRARAAAAEPFASRVAGGPALASAEQTLKCADLLLREGFAESALVLFARLAPSVDAWLGVAQCHLARGVCFVEACWALAHALKLAPADKSDTALRVRSARADALMQLHNYRYAGEDAALAGRADVAALAAKRGAFLNTREGATASPGMMRQARWPWDPFLCPWPEPARAVRVAIAPRGATAEDVFGLYMSNVALLGRYFGHAPLRVDDGDGVHDARRTWFMPLSSLTSWMLDTAQGALTGNASLVVGEGWLACFPVMETARLELAAAGSADSASGRDVPLLCWNDVLAAARGTDAGLMASVVCGQASARRWTERTSTAPTAWVSSAGHRCVVRARKAAKRERLGDWAMKPPRLFSGALLGRRKLPGDALEVLEMDARGVWVVAAAGVDVEEAEALERDWKRADWSVWGEEPAVGASWRRVWMAFWLSSALVLALAVALAFAQPLAMPVKGRF